MSASTSNAVTSNAVTSKPLPVLPPTIQELDRIHDMATSILADLDRLEASLQAPLLTM